MAGVHGDRFLGAPVLVFSRLIAELFRRAERVLQLDRNPIQGSDDGWRSRRAVPGPIWLWWGRNIRLRDGMTTILSSLAWLDLSRSNPQVGPQFDSAPEDPLSREPIGK